MKKVLTFIILLGFLNILNTPLVNATTEISGNIVNPVWTVENSPYLVNGTLEVAKGAKLTINPGVVVKFNGGSKILVKGQLEILGEENNKVILTSNLDIPARGDWKGIEFDENSKGAKFDENEKYLSGSIIKYAIIKYSESIKINKVNPYIVNNSIMNNNTGINIMDNTTSTTSTTSTYLDSESQPSIEKIIIESNEITDNTIGILINRENKNQYSSTPAGLIRQGKFLETSVIKNNKFINNSYGIYINKGDNNILSKNSINNNDLGIKIESISEENVLNNNSINNNKIGLHIASSSNKIQQNNFINNSSYGIYLEKADNYINKNNIYNNTGYNIYNKNGSISLENNYWNEDSTTEINKNIKLETTNAVAIIEPIEKSAINIYALPEVSINNFSEKTTSEALSISGTKPAGTKVFINGKDITSLSNETDWSYSASLNLGKNTFLISYKDSKGDSGPAKTVEIYREKIIIVSEPTINSFSSQVSSAKYSIYGTKEAGTSIMINNQVVIPANDQTSWSYELNLILGTNTFKIKAQDGENRQSNEVSISIIRKDIDSGEIITTEKKLIKNIDQKLAKKLAGLILLQTEKNGMAWYVNPTDNKRYYLGRQEDAFKIMSSLGLGVKNEIIKNNKFSANLIGRILINVEDSGKAYYIYPKDKKAYSLGRPADAYKLMRELSLGITNENIYKIEIGE
jgi:parallel beta-helix repeat protein